MTMVQNAPVDFAVCRDTDARIEMLTTISAQGTADEFLQQLSDLSTCDAEGLALARAMLDCRGSDDGGGGSDDGSDDGYAYDDGSDDEYFPEPERPPPRPKGGVEESKGGDDYDDDYGFEESKGEPEEPAETDAQREARLKAEAEDAEFASSFMALQETAATLWNCCSTAGTIATALIIKLFDKVGAKRGRGKKWVDEQTPRLLEAAAATMAPGTVRSSAKQLRTGLGMALREDAFYDFLAASHEVLRFKADEFDVMAAEAVQAKYGEQPQQPQQPPQRGFYEPDYGRRAPRQQPPGRPQYGLDAPDYGGFGGDFGQYGGSQPPRRAAPRPHVDAREASKKASGARTGKGFGEARFTVAQDWKDRLARAKGSYAPRIDDAAATAAPAAAPRPASRGPKAPKPPGRVLPPSQNVFIDHPLDANPNPGAGPCLVGIDWGELDRLLGRPF